MAVRHVLQRLSRGSMSTIGGIRRLAAVLPGVTHATVAGLCRYSRLPRGAPRSACRETLSLASTILRGHVSC